MDSVLFNKKINEIREKAKAFFDELLADYDELNTEIIEDDILDMFHAAVQDAGKTKI